MRDWFVLIAHLIVTTIRIVRPCGARAIIAESLLLKHQLLILNRSRRKAPRLRTWDRILLGLGAMLVAPQRLLKVAVAVRPATLLRFHRTLVRRKYQWLFSSSTRGRPGPKGPPKALIAAILEIKRLNPRFGCPRIAQQISQAFGLEIDKDVVRRILANHPLAKSGGSGPSWLCAIAEARNSLWSVDLFRCESILLKSFWVMVVMDVFSRRIVGFGVEPTHITASVSAACSTEPGTVSHFPSASVPIMTRCSDFIAGERICAFSTSRNLSPSPSCLAPTRLSSDSSEPFGASISTEPSSGTASTSIAS